MKEAADSTYWHRLIHYKKNILVKGRSEGLKSLADSPDFFLAGTLGKTDPQAELIATIEAAINGKKIVRTVGNYPIEYPTVCAFPARIKFIRTFFPKLKDLGKNQKCADYDEWRNRIYPKDIVLVFTTSYANNPASMFGHTFIKFNRSGEESNKKDLLDYAITFSAETVTQDRNFVHILKGLLGSYRGFFNLDPYYVKVREYNYIESRDLWEYRLQFDRPGIERIVAHLWELYLWSWFDYYFLDENCSYHLLALLELGNLQLELTNDLKSYVTIPHETLISLAPIVKSVNFRPGLRNQVIHKYQMLAKVEKQQVVGVIQGKLPPKEITSVKVSDLVVDTLNYIKHDKEGQTDETFNRTYRQALVARSQLTGTVEHGTSSFNLKDSPHFGHRIVKTGLGTFDRMPLWHFRLGFHDFLDVSPGFNTANEITGLEMNVVYQEETRKALIREFNLLTIKSVFPINDLEKKISWGLEFKVNTDDQLCTGCRGAETRVNIGLGAELKNILFYSYIKNLFDFNTHVKDNYRWGVGLENSAVISFGNNWKGKLTHFLRSYLHNDTNTYSESSVLISYSPWRNMEIRSGQFFDRDFRLMNWNALASFYF